MALNHIVIMTVGGLEAIWLMTLHSKSLVTWEPIWVIFISWLSYTSDLIDPDSQWAKPTFDNGEYIDWQKMMGWMATCPVLILFLVSLTTFGGREASVRVVPLLVANQMMFLCGATSAMCTAPARWYFYSASVFFGAYVFISSGLCFRSLYQYFQTRQYFGADTSGATGRSLVLWLTACFFLGWVVFPIVWTIGHSGTNHVSDYACSIVQMFGDLLSKNLFIVLAVTLKHRYLTEDPKPLSALLLQPTQPFTWSEFNSMLGETDTVADGAVAQHEPLARLEAARKLITNHHAVLNDITRSDAPAPVSQPARRSA